MIKRDIKNLKKNPQNRLIQSTLTKFQSKAGAALRQHIYTHMEGETTVFARSDFQFF